MEKTLYWKNIILEKIMILEKHYNGKQDNGKQTLECEKAF